MNDRITAAQWRALEAGTMTLDELEQAQTRPAPVPAPSGGGYQKAGDVLEAQIIGECELLEQLGLADVFKVPNPTRIEHHYPGTNQVRARLEGARWVDFAGLIDGGRNVAIEAKAIDLDSEVTDRLLFSKVNGKQREKLESVAALGGLALVYTGQVRGDIVVSRYLIPVADDGRLAGMTRPGSFIFEDHPRHRLRRGQDWLNKACELGFHE
jgi:hypothetical protein